MNVKKSLLVLGAVTGIGLAVAAGLGLASAATNSSGTDSIIDRLATKFNLDKNDVAAVFEEEKTARQAEHQQKLEDRLTQAVKDGKITEEQKAKILAKLEELKTQRQSLKDKTPEERRQAMKELHQQLRQWAEDNNIPFSYLMFMHGRHHGWAKGGMPDQSSDL